MDLDIGISGDRRKEIAEALGRLLANTYAVGLKTQYYHWNVTGPRFRELHLMFEEQYEELAVGVDAIAERIRTLGFWAPGTLAEFSRMSSIPEDESVPASDVMARTLRECREAVLRTAREVLGIAERAEDHGTVDLVTEQIAAHEKRAWMLAATGRDV